MKKIFFRFICFTSSLLERDSLLLSLTHTHSPLFVVAFFFLILKRSIQNHNRSLLLSLLVLSLALQNSLFFAAFSILFFFVAFISSLPHPPGDDWGQRHRRWETNRARRFVCRVRNRYRTNFL
jgi:magnesium-transporting ATPase (P-type)